MRLLKKLTFAWYEWVFIGVVLVVGLGFYIQTKRLDHTQEQLVVSDQAVQQAVLIYETSQQRRQIDNSVVATVTETLTQTRHDQDRLREDIINDYLIFQPPEPAVATDTTEPDAPSTPDRDTETQPPPTTETDDRARLDQLSRGLRDIYCRAGGTDGTCTPRDAD